LIARDFLKHTSYKFPEASVLFYRSLPSFLKRGGLNRCFSGDYPQPAALGLFCFNIMAVLSHPVLWEQSFYDHRLWGAEATGQWYVGTRTIDSHVAPKPL